MKKSQVFITLMLLGILLSNLNGASLTSDTLNRVIKADYGNGAVTTYTYDSSGNRLTHTSSVPSNGFDEFLNFNDNQVPSGWTLGNDSNNGNASVANQRFEVRQVDTSAGLNADKVFPAAFGRIQVEYTGNISANEWGQATEIHLLMPGNMGFYVGLGKAGNKNVQISLQAGRFYTPELNKTLPLDTGTYRVTAVFEDGKITFSATKSGASSPFFSESVAVPTLAVHQLQSISLFARTTTGDPSWMDDVSIKALPPRRTYTSWQLSHFSPEQLSNPLVVGWSADPDGDGLINAWEYFFGFDPNAGMSAAERASLPHSQMQIVDSSQYLAFIYQRLIDWEGAQEVIEVSDDLRTWDDTESQIEQVGNPVANADGLSETITVRIRVPISSNAVPRKFMRLKLDEIGIPTP